MSLGFLLVSGSGLLMSTGLIVIQSYHLFSVLRLAHRPSRYIELQKRYYRTAVALSLIVICLLSVAVVAEEQILSQGDILYAAVTVQAVAAIIGLMHLRTTLSTAVFTDPDIYIPDKKLPSITVALPARNETGELEQCLESILASNYPKMEVLVLDDCSQDATAQIIREFAHRGVRFIEGTPPQNSWLAKNHAYHQLLGEAEGAYVVFCGVDARFGQTDLKKIVTSMIQGNKIMSSILPSRPNQYDGGFLLQPLRYYRELVFPKLLNKTPPVISTVWVAERNFIEKNGGFAAAKKTIRPERYFARIAHRNSKYIFFIAGNNLGLFSVKNLRSQWNTAVRTRYPECSNRVERVFVTSLWYCFALLMPGCIFVSAILFSFSFYVFGVSFLTTIILLYIHSLVGKTLSGSVSIKKIIMYPVSVILEVAVTNYSMWAYEFSEVTWKGRNVCRPILSAIPRLPKV